MRVQGTQQLGYISNGINLNTLGSFPQERAKEFYSYPRYYLFDFGAKNSTQTYITSSPDINNNYWNNFTGQATISGIRSTKNINTNINVLSASGFGFGTGAGGGLVNPNPSLLGDFAISTATTDYYFVDVTAPIFKNIGFRVHNLSTYNIYDFSFFGSRNLDITPPRVTAYFVSGANGIYSGTLTTTGPNIGSDGIYDGNDNKILTISGIQANANGQILFYTNSVSGNLQYINAMKIKENLYGPTRALAVGGSQINYWDTINTDLSPVPILNNGIAGSSLVEWMQGSPQNYWNNRLAVERNPLVIINVGSNDVTYGNSANTVYNNTVKFFNDIKTFNPSTEIVYLSIIRSPDQKTAGKIETINQINNSVQNYALTGSNITFVDINSLLADVSGNALETGLFRADDRHLTASGYAKVTQVLKPIVTGIWNNSTGYRLVWEDDFNGTILNTNNWYAHDDYPESNGELQFYTSRTGITGNLNVSGSILYLTARSGSYTAKGPWMPAPKTAQFTSALVETLNKRQFEYGKIEASIRMPSGSGLWPAFWMLGMNYFDPGIGFPRCGEIDIMEHANIQPSYTAALHTLNRSHLTSKGGWVQGKEIASANYNTQFNIYGAEWTPEQVSFHFNNQTFYTVTKNQAGGGIGSFTFIDPQPADGNYTIYQDGVDQGGRFTISAGNVSITDPGCNYDATRNVSGAFPNGARMSITSSVSCDTSDTHWPFNQPFWIKLNLAVGGSYGATPSQEAFPSTMEIDWVKVYQK